MKPLPLWIFAVTLLAVLVWGLEQVVVGPLETGEAYPPYSSLRSDPLGAKALYESLAALPDLRVERLYKTRSALEGSVEALLVLGTEPVAWSALKNNTLEEYERLVRQGGRLVIAFVPVRVPQNAGEQNAVEARWHLKFSYARPSGEDDRSAAIPRDSALRFEAGPEWRRLGGREAIERGFGAGSIVLIADSYPLSNQGLRDARDAQFISTLLGPARRIVFDENHFGVVETGSVTKLIRKYRLQRAIAVLAVLAALFLWRSASSFLPPRETSLSDAVTGRDSTEGMTALLRRGVPEKELLDVCYAEWAKSVRGAIPPQVEEAVRQGKSNPVEAYRAASRAIGKA